MVRSGLGSTADHVTGVVEGEVMMVHSQRSQRTANLETI
jgi:hypothetical protein